jgi:hypothetical protein
MSAEYEMTVTALRALPEKDQKLAMVKNRLLEEETKRMIVRRFMRPKVNTDTVTALASHKHFQQSKWKEEGASSFPFNCYNRGMKGHKRRYCRKPAQYSGNQQSGRLNNGSNYGGQRFHGNRRDGNKFQPKWRNQRGSAQCTEKASSEGGAGIPYTFVAETGNSEAYLSTKKNITWVLDSGSTDHLVKEDTHVVNKYELPVPTKTHIAKIDNYLLAFSKGDIIAESCAHGQVRNIKIPDVFLVKDLSYYSLSVSNLDRKVFIINIDNGKAKIIKKVQLLKLQIGIEMCIN